MKRTLAAVFLLALLTGAIVMAQRKGTLTASCDPCSVGEQIAVDGTRYQSNGNNDLQVVAWGQLEADYATCSVLTKSGDFTCTLVINTPGTYTIDAYDQPNAIFASIGPPGIIVNP